MNGFEHKLKRRVKNSQRKERILFFLIKFDLIKMLIHENQVVNSVFGHR